MTYALHTIPSLSDNYAFALVKGTDVAIFDAPEAGPILDWLDANRLSPSVVVLTHHHHDHVGGVDALRERGAEVWGAAADAHRLPELDRALAAGAATIFGDHMDVIDVPGHTVGHVAYHVPAAGALFSGDSLMAMGCGRLFEGTAAQMWDSLQKLRALPGDTKVCSGHEYTAGNMRFALTVESENPDLRARASEIETLRAQGRATVPSILSTECATNPFLRADTPALKAALKMEGAPDVEVFAAVRKAKDSF